MPPASKPAMLTPTQAPTPSGIPDVFVIDEQKIQASENTEKQELYVLQWLAQVERESKTVDVELLKMAQPIIEKTLFRLISLVTAKPRRPIRFLIGRCYVILYTRGDTRTLFDSVTALHSLISANKNIDKETRIAAIATTGAIMGASGGKVLSLFADTATIFLKLIKTSSNPLLMKLETITAFTLLLKGAGKAATEQILKDLMKQLRHGLVDKALVLRIASAQCMQAVIQHAIQTLTPHDIEGLLQHCFKAFDSSTFPVRRAVSSLCATLLVFTQSQATVDPSKPNVKHALTGEGSKKTEEALGKGVTLMSTEEMLGQLSSCYNRLNASRELKTGIIETYATLFVLLGTEFVEANYAVITKHILCEILDPSRISTASEGAYLRSHVNFLLHHTIGKSLLSEQGQANAIRLLVSNWIKKWPALMATQSAPNKDVLICVINLVSELVCELEGASSSVQGVLVEPLFVLLTHTSFSVQIAAVWCIRCVCNALPTNLLYLLPKSLNLLEKNLGNLTNQTTTAVVFQRTIAYAYTVASIMSVFPAHPIYTSFELSARAMALANQLIKQTNKDPKIASVQVQVAWTLVGSVMCLGPNLVKIHLPQLLLLWKSDLPKPTGKEANAIRSEPEWSLLFHRRECVTSSIYSFLAHNSQSLVTLDIAKRIAALLNNTLAFLATAPTTFAVTTMSPCTPHETRLIDQFYSLRRRIFQCFITIRPLLSTYESSLSSLLRNSLSVFTEPDRISPSSGAHHQVTATVPGQFVSVWNTADGHGYGVTSKMQGYHVDVASQSQDGSEESTHSGKEWMTKDRFERVEELLERPIIGSLELDPFYSYTNIDSNPQQSQRQLARNKYAISQPVSPSTSYIDASIELFATLFANQPASIQESTFELMVKVVKDPKLEKNSPKRAAILVNIVVALLGAFKNIMAFAKKKKRESVEFSPRATQLVQEILMEVVVHPDPYLRNAASETIGRLTSIVGGSFVAAEMQLLVDLVVSNRDPDVRAGCALAIGYIYTHVGGMAAAAHLKTIVGILLSLSSDPHPVVHAWALEAMAMTVSAAGLMFSGYVNSTLGMVAKLYLSETHEPGSGSIAVTNAGMSVGFTAYQEFGRIIYELIGTLGPELQASSKVRELCLNMVEELKLEPDERVNVEAIRCIQHFLMFAPKFLDTRELVPYLQSQITSLHLPLKKAAVTCLYQLVQRDSELVFKAAQPGLDTELFKMLDTDPQLSDVKNVIRSWLQETAVAEPSIWVNITKRIVTGSGGNAGNVVDGAVKSATAAREHTSEDGYNDDFGDDDADGFVDDEDNADIATTVADASGITAKLSVNVEIPPRWRTQLFALECLQQTIELVYASGIREHFNLILARKRRQQAGLGDFLVFRVPDLIRLSFTAATAHVNELRLAGINLLKLVIEKFSNTLDADLEDMLLLEQYSAQIGAALTPAFGADSSSEIVSAAVRVCAIYVGSGIVKDLYQLGRVLKLLISALDRCKGESKLTGVGEVKDLSPHASVMVKLSVLNAWAELQVASQKQAYLKQVLQPNLAVLSPMWLRALQDYARIRLESDIVALSSRSTERIQASSNSGIDSMYSAATKDVVLPYYRRSWLKIMEAVATLIETNAPSMTEAISSNPDSEQSADHPSNLFYILFGLCIESLSRISSSSSNRYDNSTIPICLRALRTFVQPSLAGKRFVPKSVFLELMNVFDRLIQTEGYRIQLVIIEIIQRLIQSYGTVYLCNDLEAETDYHIMDVTLDQDAFPATAKLYYLLRLLINVFVQNVPRLSNKPASSRRSAHSSKENIPLLLGPSLDTLALLVDITPKTYIVDLLAICFYIFSVILTEPKFETMLAPRVLVSLKAVLHNFEADLRAEDISSLSKITCAITHSLLDDFNEIKSVASQKNRLLAVVLILTGCPSAALRDGEGINVFFATLKKSLVSDNVELSITAHQCLRNFISLLEKKGSVPALASLAQAVVKSTLSFIIEHILKSKASKDNASDVALAALDQDVKTVLTLLNGVPEEQKPTFLGVILPTLTHLLDDPPYNGHETKVHEATLVNLLAIATSTPAVFRDTVSKLPGNVKTKLESAMRFSILASQEQQQRQQQKEQQLRAAYEDSKQPTIALKMDFSNFG
ncbi:armadillo-type protein [Parasitella parasitica]|nr:armadillo-type protein [Parasitella parasitica]